MADEKPEARATPPTDATLHIVDQPYVVGLIVADDQGNEIVIDNSTEGVLVPADQVEAVHLAAYNVGIKIEEVS
jgi:hypothetical protein